jgi:pimeloyl-ACP methyl ester carboxylesterase
VSFQPLNATSQIITFTNYNEANTLQFAGSGNAFRCIGIGDSVYWAGTQYKGLYKYDTTIKVWYKSSQLTNVFINDIKRDKNGGVWIAQSGTSGQTGGGSNIGGGINYFPEQYDVTMKFYSVPGTTTGGGLVSRNVRSLYIDNKLNKRIGANTTLPKVWAAAATYITSGNTATGGISIGLMAVPNYFESRKEGLQLAPFNGSFPVGTPSCDAVGGNDKEVWVATRQNFGRSQIIRYRPSTILKIGTVIGKYDNVSDSNIFAAGFRAQAICFDTDDRRWIGFQTGGLAVLEGEHWTVVNSVKAPTILPVGTSVNNNAIIEDGVGNVYIGTTTGLLVFDGGGAVDDTTRYIRYTTTDGLPSNNITGLAYDTAKGRLLIASDAGITFMTVRNPIDVSLEWDHSFPDNYRKPVGVCADGVSRVYLKIKNGDPNLPPIKNIEVSFDKYSTTDSSQRGKLKAATAANLNTYSEEANSGGDFLVYTATETKPGEFWFWYKAPTDFSNDSLGRYANLSIRSDDIKIKVTYTNNATGERIYKKLRVVRPPLLLVHGLADGPHTWNVFKHDGTIPFIKDKVRSSRFKYVNALTINGRGSFAENAVLLMSGDKTNEDSPEKLNTLVGNIEQIRQMGYACNQVDYVCHSMGGIIIRYAIEKFKDKFYAGASSSNKYKTYGAGFTHKIITINTPHNSSIIADLVYDYIPQAPEIVNKGLTVLYQANKDFQQPFDFVEPEDKLSIFKFKASKFIATPAVTNLKVKDDGGLGINLAETRAKFHIITSNVMLTSEATATTLAEFHTTLIYVQKFIQSMLDSRFIPPNVKAFLNPLLVGFKIGSAITFLNWYSNNLGFPNFTAASDLIVPLESENARIPLPGAKRYISPFTNSPGSYFDASHISILGRKDVGQKVFNLLNSQLYGPLFGDVIPANTDADPNPVLAARSLKTAINTSGKTLDVQVSDSTFYDTTKIRIDAPLKGAPGFAADTLGIKYRLKDTANLCYVMIHYQNTDTFFINKTKAQQTVEIPTESGFPGAQEIWAAAAYYTPDNGLKYYIDTFNVFVATPATLGGFRVNDSDILIKVGSNYIPPYQVSYQDNVWVPLPSTDSNVTVSFDPAGIIYRVDSNKVFKALTEGITTAVFKYNNITDTVIMQGVLPLDSFAINRTIAAGNFKNPAIWSKGEVPDLYDSVVVLHSITVDTSITVGSLRINAGSTLSINNAAVSLNLGFAEDSRNILDNYGTLVIQNGTINVQGKVKLNTGSTFNMSGGKIKIDGNTGTIDVSIKDGTSLFEAAPSLVAFNFTGGTLQFVDPPLGAASQTINCPYDFGPNSTLILGDGTSTTASKNTDGFGGNLFPNKIGKLIIDAAIKTGNRQFINKKALNVKGNMEVKTGSGVILQAPITVNQ